MQDKTQLPYILYVITKSNWGGAQKYVYELALEAKSKGFKVKVALGGHGILRKKLLDEQIETIVIENLRRNISIKDEYSVFKELIEIFKKEKPDVLHLNSSKIGGLGSLAGRIARIKNIIYTAHGWSFNETFRNRISRFIIKLLSYFTILFSHKIIVLSEQEKDQFKNWPFTQKKIKVIRLGIRATPFLTKTEARSSLESQHKELKADHTEKWIGTIAELHKNKGLKYAIKAIKDFKKDKNLRYLIIGDGEEKSKLEKLIRELKLENRVFLMGNIENAAQILKAFDYFVLPSTKEGLPYVLLEAGEAQLPVITTEVGGIPELIDNLHTGILIKPRKINHIVRALEYLYQNPSDTQQMAHNLNKKVGKNYSIHKMFSKTIELY